MHTLSYLALGDSYTIGEAVALHQAFPYQTVQVLRHANLPFAAPEILAKTGWTTGELIAAMEAYVFNVPYDVVTLLIGVNNQYRGLVLNDYRAEFEALLKKAIQFAGDQPHNVFVLSIPDYSVTPFAQALDMQKIEVEINAYNALNHSIAAQCGAHYINITESTRLAKTDATLLAEDGLHPSATEYGKWAQLVAEKISMQY